MYYFLQGFKHSFYLAGFASLIAGTCAFVLLGYRARALAKKELAQ